MPGEAVVAASTGRVSVKHQLRLLGEPIAVFGETENEARRRLLRAQMRAVRQGGNIGTAASGEQKSAQQKDGAHHRDKDVFSVSKAAASLVGLRQRLFDCSVKHASSRLQEMKARFSHAAETMSEHRRVCELLTGVQEVSGGGSDTSSSVDNPYDFLTAPVPVTGDSNHSTKGVVRCLWSLDLAVSNVDPVLSGGSGRQPFSAISGLADASHLVTGAEDGTVAMWCATTGQLADSSHTGGGGGADDYDNDNANGMVVPTPPPHLRRVNSVEVAWSSTASDRLMAASSSNDGAVAVWSLAGVSRSVASSRLAKNHDDAAIFAQRLVLVGVDRTAHVGRALGLAWCPTMPELLASTGEDASLRLYDVATGVEGAPSVVATHVGHQRATRGVAFHPDGALLATGDGGGATRLWDVRCGRSVGVVASSHMGAVTVLRFSPNGVMLFSGGMDGVVHGVDVRREMMAASSSSEVGREGGKASLHAAPLLRTAAHSDAVSSLMIVPASLAVGSATLTTHGDHAVVSAGYDGSIAVWDAWAANALLFRYQGFALDGGGPCRSITLTATPRALGGKSVEDAPASSRLAIAYVGHDATWRTLLLRAPHQLETTARHVAASSLADLAAAKRAVLMASIAARAGVRPPAAAASDDEDDDLVALKKRK